MKRIAAALLLVGFFFSFAGCRGINGTETDPPPQESPVPAASPTPAGTPAGTPESPMPAGTLQFTRETMPRLDGSTSTAPLAVAVCAALLGESEEDVADLVQFSKTTNAYFNLLQGGADLLIVGEANEEVYAEKERLGFEWEQTPFATDAFVFVVNEDNPVNSITVEQARDIYTGRITNWRELGGEDREIIPLQRNSGAGSQTLMEKLVMQGEPMMEAPTGYVVATMGQLMEAVKSYDNSPGAIGYSVYYYAEEMKMARGLKLLQLEGVAPNPETIRSETYPLVNPKYVVIPADAAADAPNRMLYNWLLSEEGQRLIAAEGYVSVLALDVTPSATPLVGGRWYASYTGSVLPRDDYGTLIPYAGQRLADDWPSLTGCLYGLMTETGIAVTDPVFSGAARASYYKGGWMYTLPLLLLRQGDPTAESWSQGRTAVCAADGSWCTEFSYELTASSQDGLLLFAGETLTVMAPDGAITHVLTRETMGIAEEDWSEMIADLTWGEGPGAQRYGDRIVIRLLREDDSTPYEDLQYLVYDLGRGVTDVIESAQYEEMSLQRWEPSGEEPVYAVENTEPIADRLYGADAPYLLLKTTYGGEQVREYFLSDGTPLPELTIHGDFWYRQVSLVGGLIEELDLNTASYYDPATMTCVFRTYLGYEGE